MYSVLHNLRDGAVVWLENFPFPELPSVLLLWLVLSVCHAGGWDRRIDSRNVGEQGEARGGRHGSALVHERKLPHFTCAQFVAVLIHAHNEKASFVSAKVLKI